MTEKDLNQEWARQQIEAMADGSLDRDERERMLDAMRVDARLRGAVERARALHGGLRRLRAPAPRGLLRRLLAVPGADAQRPGRSWLIVLPIAAAAMAAVVALQLAIRPAPPPVPDEQAAAIREFTLAMTYLQKSAAYTGGEVGGIVSAGMSAALTASRDALNQDSEDENGG